MAQNDEKEMYDYADKFINLANEMSKADRSGKVGVAFRYAAARYSAFEASMRTKNLADDKDEQLELFVEDFKKMLQYNLEDYINIVAQK